MILIGEDDAKVELTCCLVMRDDVVKHHGSLSYRLTAEVVATRQLTDAEREEIADIIFDRVRKG